MWLVARLELAGLYRICHCIPPSQTALAPNAKVYANAMSPTWYFTATLVLCTFATVAMLKLVCSWHSFRKCSFFAKDTVHRMGGGLSKWLQYYNYYSGANVTNTYKMLWCSQMFQLSCYTLRYSGPTATGEERGPLGMVARLVAIKWTENHFSSLPSFSDLGTKLLLDIGHEDIKQNCLDLTLSFTM